MAVASGSRVGVRRFQEEGYLVVEDVLDVERDIEPVVREYEALLDEEIARWHAEGKIPSTYEDLPFARRLAAFLTDAGQTAYQAFDITLPVRRPAKESRMHVGPAVFGLLTNPHLLDVIEQLIGPEILSNPIQHVRIKPPEAILPADLHKGSIVGQTDWHQDQGTALPEVDDTELLTVWLPITDATLENGCLCVVPRSHTGGLRTHCPARPGSGAMGLRIPEELRGTDFTPVPIRRGGALFLHRRTMHASLRNLSDGARWSFDLRYQPVGQPTGRPWFPSFVVRSRKNPSSELHEWRGWAELWRQARERLAASGTALEPTRWDGSDAICA